MLGTTLGVFFFSGILALTPASVFAQDSGSASTQRLASEYQRLRADLDRLNAEVAALKSRGRSVRTDYLLRDKMAEAEALARRVTVAEARLRAVRGPLPAAATPSGTVQTPAATSQDGAVELEAKADLLSDQARRFRGEAEALARTAEQIRARQALRRRAGAWDRDPLAGFEASKRVAVISPQSSHLAVSGDSSGASAATRGPGTSSSDVAPKSGTSSPTTASTPGEPVASVVAPPGSFSVSATVVAGSSIPGAVPTTSAAAPSASHPLTASAPLSTDSASKAGVQQRALLDPATLAGIRNTLSQAGSLSDPDAVDAAATALRNHAQALDEQARRLRARASQ
jgi:prefoldin subunit 5